MGVRGQKNCTWMGNDILPSAKWIVHVQKIAIPCIQSTWDYASARKCKGTHYSDIYGFLSSRTQAPCLSVNIEYRQTSSNTEYSFINSLWGHTPQRCNHVTIFLTHDWSKYNNVVWMENRDTIVHKGLFALWNDNIL